MKRGSPDGVLGIACDPGRGLHEQVSVHGRLAELPPEELAWDPISPVGSSLPAPALRTVTAAQLLDEPEPPCDWLVDGLYPSAGVVVQAGDPKSFKTMLALQLAVTVGSAEGPDILGRAVRHGRVLFVEEEGSRHKLRDRLAMMMGGLALTSVPDLTFALHQGVRLDQTSSVAAVERMAAELKPALIVLDPLVLLHSGEENSNSAMAQVMRPLVAWAHRFQCCVVVVHHTTKPQAERRTTRLAQRLRGAGAFAGATDANMVLDRDGHHTARLRAEYRDADPVDLFLRLDPATLC